MQLNKINTCFNLKNIITPNNVQTITVHCTLYTVYSPIPRPAALNVSTVAVKITDKNALVIKWA